MKKRKINFFKKLLAHVLVVGIIISNLQVAFATYNVNGIGSTETVVATNPSLESESTKNENTYGESVSTDVQNDSEEIKENILTPTDAELQQWQEDNTFETRMQFMQSLNSADTLTSLEDSIDIPQINTGTTTTKTVDDLSSFKNAMPSTGEVKSLVFLVQFPDCKNTDSTITSESVKEEFFGQGEEKNFPIESLSNYFGRASYNQLDISGDVYGWYDLQNDKQYYKNAASGRDELIKEVMSSYDSQIDFSQYDLDGDGYVDSIYFIYAGEHNEWGEFYWSYKANVSEEIACDNTKLNGYVFQFTEQYRATAIHETGHLMGLPDYYNYNYSPWGGSGNSESGGLGFFDMMDHNYGDYNIFSKMLLGWVVPEVISANKDFTLDAISSSSAKAVIVTPNENASIFSEYYLLELYNSENNNYNSIQCKDGGVRIYHVNASIQQSYIDENGKYYYDFTYSDSSSTELKLIKLLESDGTEENGLYGYPITADKYYYSGMTFGTNTAPSSEFYNKIYTGINIKFNNVTKDNANVSVKFENVDNEAPKYVSSRSWDVLGKVVNLSDYRVYFNSYIYAGESLSQVNCYEKNNEDSIVAITAEIIDARTHYSKDDYICETISGNNILMITSDATLKEGTEYVIEIPAGALLDCYGNTNSEIKLSFTTLQTVNNLTYSNYNLKELPQNVSDEYYLVKYNPTHDLSLSDDSMIFVDCAVVSPAHESDADYLNKPALLAYKRFCEDGANVNTAIILKESWAENQNVQKVFELSDGNICVVLLTEYVVLDKNGNLLTEVIFKNFATNFTYLNFIPRENSIDVANENSKEHEIYRINMLDGSYVIISNEISSELLCYYDENYKIFDEEKYHKDIYENKDFYKSFMNKNYDLNVVGHNCPSLGALRNTYLQDESNDNYVYRTFSSKSFNVMTMVAENDSYVDFVDKNHYLLSEIKMESKIGIATGLGIVKIDNGEGYLAIVEADKKLFGSNNYLNIYGCYVIRMDDNYNIKWVTYLKGSNNVINSAYYNNGKIKAIISSDVIELEDIDQTYISADKQFSIENPNITLENLTQTLKVKAGMTAGDIIGSISGEFGEIKYYNSSMEQVTDTLTTIFGGLISVQSKDELYTWYFKVDQQEGAVVGDVTQDNNIDIYDILAIQRHILGTEAITGIALTAADVTRDSSVDIFDILAIQRHILGVESIQ